MELISDTITENGDAAFSSTSDKNLDLFFHINAMRARSEGELHALFNDAFKENPEDAMKILFWSRDIRGGQGERRAFRVLISWLASRHPNVLRKNLHLIPEYGRWDDMLTLFGTELEDDVLAIIRKGLVEDKNGLCAKWMPREKSANKVEASKIRKFLGMSPKEYRKTLASMTKVVESQMCSQDWDKIDFERVPSQAMKNYSKAFRRHNEEGFSEFLNKVEKGEAKINAGAMYPHDIVRNFLGWSTPSNAQALQAQWDALPDYMNGNPFRVLPVCDVSGSMSGIPMEVCISLGIYVSERNVGGFQNAFVTFSESPQLQYLSGKLANRVSQLRKADWGMSTDLNKVFSLILDRAKKHNIPEDEMPEMLIIFSDMQFNSCVTGGQSKTTFEKAKESFEAAGYTMPRIAFWNLRAVTSSVPVTMNENGVALVSGFSPSILKQLLSTGDFNPLYIMRKTIDDERYKAVKA